MSVSRSVVGLLLLAIVAGLLWLVTVSPLPSSDASLTVAATIFPLADIIRHVGGDTVAVVLLVPPGTTEHSSALQPDQLAQLSQAAALFTIGHGLDNRLADRVRAVNGEIEIVTVDQGIALRQFSAEAEPRHDEDEAGHAEEELGSIDPHYWLTVPNASLIAETVAAKLVEHDPTHAAEYEANLSIYQAELAALEAELQTATADATQPHFMAMHNAWSYLAAHYGFELVATYEPIEGQQPTLTDLQQLQEIVRQHNLTIFYAEPQKVSGGAIRFIQRELGLTISTLDPVGGTPPNTSYQALMRNNINALAHPGGNLVQ